MTGGSVLIVWQLAFWYIVDKLTGEDDPAVKAEAAKPVLGELLKMIGQLADP